MFDDEQTEQSEGYPVNGDVPYSYNSYNAPDTGGDSSGYSEDMGNTGGFGGDDGNKPNKKSGILSHVIVGVICLTLGLGIGISTAAVNRVISFSGVSDSSASSSSSDTSSESGDYVSEISVEEIMDAATTEKLETIFSLINTGFANEFDLDSVREGLIDGLVDGLGDQYTDYYTEEEYTELTMQTSGSYYGIGALLGREAEGDAYVLVTHVYADSPAEEAGLEDGDYIIAVDGETISADEDTSDVATKIRGEEGTTVTLTIQRDGENMELEITRGAVAMETVAYEMIDESNMIGYVQVASFTSNTEEQFADALADLEEQGMKSLIIDLRDNGGGVVSECAEMLDDLLPEGTVVYTLDKAGNRTDYTSDDETQLAIPMVVLVNGNSASASEIFTAAMMDYEWATVIGTTTYGKGVYQSIYSLTDGSGIKITVGKFYSPLGNNFDQVGIEPDIELEYENTAGEDAKYSTDTDNQIQKAIEVLEDAGGD